MPIPNIVIIIIIFITIVVICHHRNQFQKIIKCSEWVWNQKHLSSQMTANGINTMVGNYVWFIIYESKQMHGDSIRTDDVKLCRHEYRFLGERNKNYTWKWKEKTISSSCMSNRHHRWTHCAYTHSCVWQFSTSKVTLPTKRLGWEILMTQNVIKYQLFFHFIKDKTKQYRQKDKQLNKRTMYERTNIFPSFHI